MIFTNDRYCDMIGLPREQVVGRKYTEIAHLSAETARVIEDTERKMIATGEVFAGPIESRADDRNATYWAVKFPIPRPDQPPLIGTVLVDISKQIEAEQAVQRWAHVFEHAEWGIVIGSVDMTTLETMNPAFARMHGFVVEELIGKPILSVFAPGTHEEFLIEVRKAHQTGHHAFESIHVRKDGSTFPVNIDITAVKDDSGKVLYRAVIVQDITERKRAEDEIIEAKEEWERTFDAITDPVMVVDTDHKIMKANKAMADKLGVSATAAEGLRCTQAVHGCATPHAFCPHAKLLKDGQPHIAEIHEDRLGGDFLVSVSPLHSPDGKLIGSVHYARDITERRKMERAVESERQRLDNILEVLPPYVVLLTPDYRVAFANRVFRELFGDSDGKRCYEFLFNLTEPCEVCETFKVLKTGKSAKWEWTGPNGRTYQIFDFPFDDTDGSRLILEMGIDITERRQAELLLNKASAYNRSLIEAALDPLVTIDAQGRITDVNTATEVATGLTRSELIGTDFSDYFTEPEEARAGYQRVFEEGTVRDYPLEIRHRDGHLTPVLYNATLYRDSDGKVEGIFAAARDVTEQKAAQAKADRYMRLYATLSQVNQTIVRVSDQDEMFREICEVAIKYGKFRMAWIGRPDRESGRVVPLAVAGHNDGYLESTIITISDSEDSGRGPAGTSARQGEVMIVDDIEEDPRMAPWRFEALKRNYRSGASVPIKLKGEIVALFIMYASEPHYFTDEEASLLQEIGGDISFALEGMERERARKQAEEQVRRAAAYNRNLIEASIDPLVTIAIDGKITDVNQATEKVTGLDRDELIGTDFSTYFTEPEKARAGYQSVFDEGTVLDYPLEIRHRDGHLTPVLYNATVFRDEDGKVEGVFAAARDISERKLAERQILHDASFPLFNPSPIVELDFSRNITFRNPAADHLLDEFGFMDAKVFFPEDIGEVLNQVGPDMLEPIDRTVKIGDRIISERIIYAPGFDTVRIYGRDVTEQKMAEARASYFMRLYATLSEVNQTIVHVKSEDQLFREICDVAVRHGKFRMAWIGVADEATMRVRAVASSGFDDGYLEKILVTVSGSEQTGNGPTGTALREGKLVICDDIENEPSMAPWREDALRRGYRSSAAVPVKLKGVPIAVFTMYASETGFFTAGETSLLAEIGDDISFALDWLERERERHAAIQALEESEEKYRTLINNIPDVTWTADGQGRTTFISQNVKDVFGFTAEEIYEGGPDLWFGRIHPDDKQGVEASFQHLVETGKSFDVEYRIQRKDGKWIWLHDRGLRSHGEQGEIRVDGVFADITAHRMTEDMLAEQRKLLDAFFENALTCNVILDRQFNFVRVNNMYAKACQKDKEDFQGHNHFEFFPSDALGIFQDVINTKKPFEVVARPFVFPDDPDSKVTYWDWSLLPLLNDSGEIDKLFFTLNDVTERRLAEIQLEDINQQLAGEREELERKNIAMREVLARIDEEKNNLKRQFAVNVEMALMPSLERLEKSASPTMRKSFEILKRDLKEVTSPFLSALKSQFESLSPRELEICRMIKSGMSSKEIAEALGLSPMTVQKYRELIRRKLGLTNADVNLNTYLQSMS